MSILCKPISKYRIKVSHQKTWIRPKHFSTFSASENTRSELNKYILMQSHEELFFNNYLSLTRSSYTYSLCVYACVFIFFHRKGFSWLNETINIMPEFRSAMVSCRNIFVSRTFVSTSKTIIERTFKLATVQTSVN